MILSVFFVVALFLFHTASADRDALLETDYCIKYFGSIRAELELADSVPKYNYNNETLCPRKWDFPDVPGAVLSVCPPWLDVLPYFEGSDGVIIDASLVLGGRLSGELSLPIDGLELGDLLITNGSVAGPFTNNGKPAVLADDPEDFEPWDGVWTINGTEKSFVPSPAKGEGPQYGVYFSCNNLKNDDKYQYCGYYQDGYNKGCWTEQWFYWHMQAQVNFTIRFSNKEATVDIWTTEEFPLNSNSSGSPSKAYLRFAGTNELPSVVDYDFWKNDEQDFEQEQAAYHPNMEFQPDGNRMPVFVNDTESGEWYSAGNATFSVLEDIASVRRIGSLRWLWTIVGLLLAM